MQLLGRNRWLRAVAVVAMAPAVVMGVCPYNCGDPACFGQCQRPYYGVQQKDRKATVSNAVAIALSEGALNTAGDTLLETVGASMAYQFLKPFGSKVQEQSKSFFDLLFAKCTVVFRWLGLGASFTAREIDQISIGATNFLVGLQTAQRGLESLNSSGRAMSMRSMPRSDEVPGGAPQAAEDVDAALFKMVRSALLKRLKSLEELTIMYYKARLGSDPFIVSNLNQIRDGLVAMQEAIMTKDIASTNDLVSTKMLSGMGMLVDSVKSACDAIKLYADPSADMRPSTASGKPYGGLGGLNRGF